MNISQLLNRKVKIKWNHYNPVDKKKEMKCRIIEVSEVAVKVEYKSGVQEWIPRSRLEVLSIYASSVGKK